MARERDVLPRERHALALEARALRNEVGCEAAARVDNAVARHARVFAVVHREAGETRGARIAGDHRDHAVRCHAAARDAADDVIDPFVPLPFHAKSMRSAAATR
jgi:hypothetical protein